MSIEQGVYKIQCSQLLQVKANRKAQNSNGFETSQIQNAPTSISMICCGESNNLCKVMQDQCQIN